MSKHRIYIVSRWILLMLALLGLMLAPLACKKEKPPPEPPPLFLTKWQADTAQIKALEQGELVSENQNFLVYKTVIADYPGHMTYEFKDGKLVKLVWNINVKNDSLRRPTLEEDIMRLVASHLKTPYYVKASKTWLADDHNLAEIQFAKAWGGLSGKTTFYDIQDVQNVNIVNIFEKLRADDKWAQGRLE